VGEADLVGRQGGQVVEQTTEAAVGGAVLIPLVGGLGVGVGRAGAVLIPLVGARSSSCFASGRNCPRGHSCRANRFRSFIAISSMKSCQRKP
jgi:hypothetical protein